MNTQINVIRYKDEQDLTLTEVHIDGKLKYGPVWGFVTIEIDWDRGEVLAVCQDANWQNLPIVSVVCQKE